MAKGKGSSNNVPIVELIVAGVLIAGGVALYFGGAGVGSTTTIIQRQESAPRKAESSGYRLNFESEDGVRTEIEAP